jgi:hypothetical protein
MMDARLSPAPMDVIKLVDDLYESVVIIYEGVTLDLGKYTLTADYVFGVNGGYILGNSSTNTNVQNDNAGKLVAPKDRVALGADACFAGTTHRVLVWDKDQNAYIFSAVTISTDTTDGSGGFKLEQDENGKTFMSVKFKLNASNFVYYNILNGNQADHGVQIVVSASWMTENGIITQNLVLSDEYVKDTIENASSMNKAAIYLEGHKNLVVTVKIVTKTGIVVETLTESAENLLDAETDNQ